MEWAPPPNCIPCMNATATNYLTGPNHFTAITNRANYLVVLRRLALSWENCNLPRVATMTAAEWVEYRTVAAAKEGR